MVVDIKPGQDDDFKKLIADGLVRYWDQDVEVARRIFPMLEGSGQKILVMGMETIFSIHITHLYSLYQSTFLPDIPYEMRMAQFIEAINRQVVRVHSNMSAQKSSGNAH